MNQNIERLNVPRYAFFRVEQRRQHEPCAENANDKENCDKFC